MLPSTKRARLKPLMPRELKSCNSKGHRRYRRPLGLCSATDRADLFGHVEIIDHDNVLRGTRAEVEFDKEISAIVRQYWQTRIGCSNTVTLIRKT